VEEPRPLLSGEAGNPPAAPPSLPLRLCPPSIPCNGGGAEASPVRRGRDRTGGASRSSHPPSSRSARPAPPPHPAPISCMNYTGLSPTTKPWLRYTSSRGLAAELVCERRRTEVRVVVGLHPPRLRSTLLGLPPVPA
jgi:hypothetical protein